MSRRSRLTAKDVVGMLFNAPNTALGLGYGYLGHGIGKLLYDPKTARQKGSPFEGPPRIEKRRGRPEFVNNPFGGVGAITFGEATIYSRDPYEPNGSWQDHRRLTGQSVEDHEDQHVIQGRHLGLAYLPSNLIGGLTALALDRNWHGERNWNERGPRMNPPRPWPPRRS